MTPSLSETFEPPSTTTYGRSGSTVSRRSTSISVGHQAAHRVRQPLRDVVHAGLLAVHDAEAVGDEGVGERGELVGERAALGVVLAGLARVEPDVLQQRRPRRPARPSTVARALSPTVSVANATSLPSSSPSRAATGAREYAGVRRALGPAEVRDHDAPGRPRRRARWIVGTLARIRPSSVIVVPSSGTFRSERTRTRLPATSPSVVEYVVIGHGQRVSPT